MAGASAPPCVPTPICRIEVVEVVKAGISSSLSQEFSHLDGPDFLGIDLLLTAHEAVFWDVGGDFFLRFRQGADPLVIVELFRGRVFSFFKNTNCVLSRNRHSSGKSPVVHLIVRVSRPRNKRLL